MMLLTVLQYTSICHHHIDTDTGTGTDTDTGADTDMYIRSCSYLSDTGTSINMLWSSSALRMSGDCVPTPSAATIKLILILLRSVSIDSVPNDIANDGATSCYYCFDPSYPTLCPFISNWSLWFTIDDTICSIMELGRFFIYSDYTARPDHGIILMWYWFIEQGGICYCLCFCYFRLHSRSICRYRLRIGMVLNML